MRHPALRFVEESGDLRGQCAEDLPQGSTLLVVPDEATVSLAAPACLKLPIGGWLMADVLTAVEQAFYRQFPDGLAVLEAHNVSLAVLMMHLALQPATALHKNMAATWPRLHALHGSLPLTYADTVLELFSGTTVSDAIRAVLYLGRHSLYLVSSLSSEYDFCSTSKKAVKHLNNAQQHSNKANTCNTTCHTRLLKKHAATQAQSAP